MAASLVEWDEENARAWVFGPWVAGGDDAWARWARPLVDAALAQLPAGIDRVEMAGDVANVRMAALAEELGWPPARSATYAASDRRGGRLADPVLTIRPATAADRETIRPVHDQEFPATYAGLERLLPDEPDGKFHVLLAEEGSRFLGYAAGRVQPDGDGYLDYLAVPDAARAGAGRTCSSPSAGTSSTPPPPRRQPHRPGPPHPRPPPLRVPRLRAPLDGRARSRRHRGSPVHSAGESGAVTGHLHGTTPDRAQAAQASGSGAARSSAAAPWAPASMGWGRRKTPPMTAARAAITAPAAKATW